MFCSIFLLYTLLIFSITWTCHLKCPPLFAATYHMGILSFSALLHSWVSAIKTNTKELEILWKVKRKSCILIMCISVSYDVSINLALGSKRLRRLMFVNLRISTFELYLPTWFIWDHNNWLIIIMVVMTDLLQFKSICNSWKCLLLTWIWSRFLILLNSCKYKGQWPSVKSVRNKGRVHTKNCNHFSRTFQALFKDHIRFSRTTY